MCGYEIAAVPVYLQLTESCHFRSSYELNSAVGNIFGTPIVK